jgi:inorganic pyrophosphatase
MVYPNNYGFVPNTLHDDGDPVDVMVRTEVTLVPGSAIRCRLIGVLHMEDDGGLDDKLIAMPLEKIDPFQAEIQDLEDLPLRHRERIWHFFENYKALDGGKWAKVTGWDDKAEAQRIVMEAIERAKDGKAAA